VSALALLGRHAANTPIAFGRAGTKTAADLLADAGRVARALPEPAPGSHVLLVSGGDRYAIAAALLGALDRGHAVALPPNLRRDSILAVHQLPDTVAVLHDTDAGIAIRLSTLLAGPEGGAPLTAPFVPRAGVIATVFTSGSTGPMLASPKTSAALLGEAHALARTFGVGPGDRIVGCVPPVHIYGLLFTLLLPLVSGAAFARETPHHAEAIAHCIEQHGATVLISVPVQLRALTALRTGALAGLRRVISSTGPLPDPVAQAFRERHGLAVSEVLGSTETGGIAHRQRTLEPAGTWRPIEGVRVTSVEGERLAVDSDYLHPDQPRPFVTADLVRLHADGSFTHLGRADGIVKIAGLRVSLQAVEDCLRQQPQVVDAAVVAIDAEGGRGQQLLAAVAPADCDTAALRTALLERFEPSCLPRRLLPVAAIPREDNGKLQRARILALFGLGADARPVVRTLGFGTPAVAREGQVDRVRVDVKLPGDWSGFDGHFEGYPVLAGAVQLKELVLPVVARAFPELGSVTSMRRVKFSGRIVPEDVLTVSLERDGEPSRVRFEIRRQEELCSSGTLGFEAVGTS
jgi:acyl-coenzyme A synthetase/AMP-(fatty) acid ligase